MSDLLRPFLLALALDAFFGDPPTALHPVGWLGRALRAVERFAPVVPCRRRAFGAAVALSAPLATALGWRWLARGIARRGAFATLAGDALALDATFALRTLLLRAGEVRRSLEAGDLEAARRLLHTHLVSRDTDGLTASEVAGAAIESVAENLSDGVIAPWLAYAALGVSGAVAYRAINTLDAMWGYRTQRYADLGRAAARLDDGANWIPARVTALAIVVAAGISGEDARAAAAVWRRDGRRTDSPNAGQPMAAMAGALRVTLAKRGAYALGAPGDAPVASDIARATRVARIAAGIVAVALTAAMLRRAGDVP